MADKIFIKGMHVTKNENAPDFILCKIGVKCNDFFEFMKANEKKGWLNIEIKEAKNGKPYAELDTWEPGSQDNGGGYSDSQDAPF